MAAVQTITTPRQRMSEEEFLRMPDNGGKYELVDGAPRVVVTDLRYGAIAAKLIGRVGPFVEDRGYIVSSQAGYRMVNGNIRCPDVSFTRYERFPGGELPAGFGDFAPDLCVEIISPSELATEKDRKLREYFAAGAQQVWHLFPEMQRVEVYTSPNDLKVYEAHDEITGGDLLPGFRVRVEELFKLRKPRAAPEG